MKLQSVAISLLVAVAWLSSGQVEAQARRAAPQASRNVAETPDGNSHTRKLMELDAWLRRLAGNFRVSGTVYDTGRLFKPSESLNDARAADFNAPDSSNPKGSMQCLGIGPGPGMHCVINVNWGTVAKSSGGLPALGWTEAYRTLRPAMMLLALDPDKLEVRLMLVDDQGNADILDGLLTGDTVTFEQPTPYCWGGDADYHTPNHCPRKIEMTARQGSEIVKLDMRDLHHPNLWAINLILHRQPDEADDKSKRP